MPIQPKRQIGRKQRQYFASKQFTDRQVPREKFLYKVDTIKNHSPSEQNYHAIMYYGVGGIGKSSLQKQLKLELLEKEPNALYTSVDFKDYTLHTPARALLELVREIKYKKKITFPHFEIAYSIYFCKRNPDISFNEKTLPFEKEFNIVGNVVAALDGMGIAGSVAGVVGKIYESRKKWNLNKEAKEQLKELEDMTVQEIEEHLVAFFAYDLTNAIEKHNVPVSVIFLDTFEALWSSLNNKTTIHTKDEWIRELIASLPNVLFVMCGREYLEWGKYDADWKTIVDHHVIENLDYKDAEAFLETCGLQETEIRNKIIKASGGYPYHLDLSVDTYFEMKNLGETITPDDFGSNQREILDRFLQYLTDSEIETLKVMSIPRFYTKEIFENLLTNHPTGYSINKYSEFNKFSFITKENEKLFIHALMRQGMLEHSSKDLVKTIHQSMAAYYDKKLDEYSTTNINQEKELQSLSETIHHRKAYMSKEEFITWLLTDCLIIMKKLQLRGESRFLRETLGELYSELGAKKLGLSVTAILIDMVHLNGEYANAIAMIDELLEGMDTSQILESQQMTQLAIRKVHHQMFSLPVDSLISELLAYEPELSEKDWPVQYNELLFMLGGNLGVLSGNLKFSRNWLIKSMKYAKETNLDNYLARATRKYVDVLRLKGHLKWAKELCEQGIHITKANGHERYEAILVCTLADIYRCENKYELAEELLEQGMKMIKKVGIKGWEGHIHGVYAELYFQKEDYHAAVQKWQEALEVYTAIDQKWGLIRANIGLERCRQKGIHTTSKNPIEYWIRKAERLNYRREAQLAERAAEDSTEIMPMIFL